MSEPLFRWKHSRFADKGRCLCQRTPAKAMAHAIATDPAQVTARGRVERPPTPFSTQLRALFDDGKSYRPEQVRQVMRERGATDKQIKSIGTRLCVDPYFERVGFAFYKKATP